MAELTWIVPYIAEELLEICPTRVNYGRWGECEMVGPFRASLGRMTHNLLNTDDPIICKLLIDIWDESIVTGRFFDSGYPEICISYGYQPILNELSESDIVDDVRWDMVTYYEKHWKFYLEVADVLGRRREHDVRPFITNLYVTAIVEDFPGIYNDDLPNTGIFVTIAIRLWKHGNEQLKSLIVKHMQLGHDQLLVRLGEFDDIIMSPKPGSMRGVNMSETYEAAIACGRDDLARRIREKYM